MDTPHEYYKLEHDVENVYSMDTLEEVDSISDLEVKDEDGSFIFEGPQDTYSFDDTTSPLAISTHNESNHPMPLHQKNFERVVVDEFVYHKYCKSRCGLLCNLAARYHELNSKIGDGGSHNTKLAATLR